MCCSSTWCSCLQVSPAIKFKLKISQIYIPAYPPTSLFPAPSRRPQNITVCCVTSALSLSNRTSKLQCKHKCYCVPWLLQILHPTQIYWGKQRTKGIVIILTPQDHRLHTSLLQAQISVALLCYLCIITGIYLCTATTSIWIISLYFSSKPFPRCLYSMQKRFHDKRPLHITPLKPTFIQRPYLRQRPGRRWRLQQTSLQLV